MDTLPVTVALGEEPFWNHYFFHTGGQGVGTREK